MYSNQYICFLKNIHKVVHFTNERSIKNIYKLKNETCKNIEMDSPTNKIKAKY